ncbi:hypothetical protein UlMin_004429 [Ulmus minor]
MSLVHGIEYAFGAHDHSTIGIFEVEPKMCPGFTFRKSILIGRTDLGPKEVRAFMEKLDEEEKLKVVTAWVMSLRGGSHRIGLLGSGSSRICTYL